MSKHPTCGTCLFARQAFPGSEELRCHRYAPRPIQASRGDDDGWSWAFVSPDDWCGEYEYDGAAFDPEPAGGGRGGE